MQKHAMRLWIAAGLSAALLGCAGSTPRIDAERLAALHKGQSTLEQVIKQFGRPSVLLNSPDGTKTARYLHSGDPSSGSIMLPLVASDPADSTTFYFDESGVLRDYKIAHASADIPTGSAQKEGPAPATRTRQPGNAPGDTAKSAQPASGKSGWSLRGLLPEPTTQNR